MKIILLSTGRGMRPQFIDDLRTKLGLYDSDVVCLVSWHRPRTNLPVNRHLVLGPHLRVRGALATVHRVQRSPELIAADASRLADAGPTDETSPTDPTSPTEATGPTDSSSPINGTKVPEIPAGSRAAGSTAHLPVLDPRRMRKAVTWRVRRLKKAARTQAASRLTGVQAHPQFRKVRNRLSPSVSLGFAASCLRAGKVHDMARDADLVVALDAASHRGAWTLAKKVPGPEVVIGIPAAKRLVELAR